MKTGISPSSADKGFYRSYKNDKCDLFILIYVY